MTMRETSCVVAAEEASMNLVPEEPSPASCSRCSFSGRPQDDCCCSERGCGASLRDCLDIPRMCVLYTTGLAARKLCLEYLGEVFLAKKRGSL